MDQRASLGEGPDRAEERRLPPGAEDIDVGRLFHATLVLVSSVARACLARPVLAIFAEVPPGELVSALGSDAAKDALIVTAKTNLVSMILILAFGTPAAYWLP